MTMYVSVERGNYWILREGEGEEVLLLLHGFTGSSSSWEPIMQKWSSNYTVIAVDLPGHGKTRLVEKFSMKSVCEDLVQILDHLRLTSVYLLGYSMGGRTALTFALLYPERVRGLILESASPGFQTKEEQTARQEQDEKLARMIESKGIEPFVDYWENIPLFQSQKHLPESLRQTIRQERLNQRPEGLAASLRYMGTGVQPSWWDHLHLLTMPVFLLSGEWDPKFIRINRFMKEKIQDCQHCVVPHAGHTVHVEQPDFFVKIVNDFILHRKSN